MTTIDNFSAITMEPKQFMKLHLNFHSEMFSQENVVRLGLGQGFVFVLTFKTIFVHNML